MKNAGVIFFNLGGRRLRAETAALNSLAVLNELFD
jgi:16S rRNA U1498 N3-methylase RsmE